MMTLTTPPSGTKAGRMTHVAEQVDYIEDMRGANKTHSSLHHSWLSMIIAKEKEIKNS